MQTYRYTSLIPKLGNYTVAAQKKVPKIYCSVVLNQSMHNKQPKQGSKRQSNIFLTLKVHHSNKNFMFKTEHEHEHVLLLLTSH